MHESQVKVLKHMESLCWVEWLVRSLWGTDLLSRGKKRSAPWDRLLEFNKGKDRCCYYFLLVLNALIAIMLVATRDSNEDVLFVVPAFQKKRRLKHAEFHGQSIFHRLFWAVLWLQSFCTVFKKL